MNRIDIKLGATMILLLISILLPLGFVMNQIFYGFYINQSQEETLLLSSQYASLINENTHENRLEVTEVAARISNQYMVVLSEEGEIWAESNLTLSEDDIAFLRESLRHSNDDTYILNSFKTTSGTIYLTTASPIQISDTKGHVLVFSSIENILQSMKTVQNLLILAGVGSLLIGLGLTYFISRKLSLPLVKMEQAARKIARGNLDTRVHEHSRDELGSLARAINDLAADLDRINKQRRQFLANISHELRTPMTYLKGYAKVLQEDSIKEEKKKQYLTIIEHEVTRLTYLVNDLFDLAKIDEGRFQLHLEKIELSNLIKQVLNKVSYKTLEKDIVLKFDSTSIEGIELIGDPFRIEQALLNIMENAIRYTPSGWVEVSVLNESKHIKIKIEDTGIGIEKKELPYIFERFYRVEKSRSRAYGGTGLGLAIVKQLVELHGGWIYAESTSGSGTTFTIVLPKTIDVKRVKQNEDH